MMIKDNWIHINKFDFEKTKGFSLDTRDFHAIEHEELDFIPEEEYAFFINYSDNRFLFTLEEMRKIIFNMWEKTGKDKDSWRYISHNNFWLKYLRTYKIGNKFILTNNNEKVLSKINIDSIRDSHGKPIKLSI